MSTGASAYDRELMKRRGMEIKRFHDECWWFTCPACSRVKSYKTESGAANAAVAHMRMHGVGK